MAGCSARLSPATASSTALQRRGMFNVIDHATGWKIDFIFRRNRAFSREEFARGSAMNLLGVDVFKAGGVAW